MGGYIDLTYSKDDQKTETAPDGSSETKSRILRHQYSLYLDKSFYQNLRFYASGLFDQTIIKSTTDAEDTTTRVTLMKPYLDLAWSSFPFAADISYNRNQTDTSLTGLEKITNISESYQGRLGWRPSDLPPLDLYFNHTNVYDKKRAFRDSVTDQISWTSAYEVFRGLQMRLQGSYVDSTDRLNNIEVKSLSNDLKTDYSNRFFNDRVSFNATYEVSQRNIDITARGKGEVAIPLFPFQGLSSVTNNPTSGALDPNPFLIDGNVTVGAGINIGLPPPGGDTRPRNIGLDFFAATELNTLFVWIDRDQLPDGIANSYSWAVYTSSDNLNWTLKTQLAAAPFKNLESHFEITFPNVTTRYIKVVVSPLTPAAAGSAPTFPDPDKIFITEIQAFTKQAAPEQSRSSSGTTHRVDSTVHVLVLERPALYYDLSYFLMRTGGTGSVTLWNLSNALSVSQRLSSVFTGNARIERLDSKTATAKSVTYQYYAALDAVPVKNLTQNLAYSGTTQQMPEGTTTTHALNLANTAQLYTGISAFLNMGVAFQSQFDGTDNKSSVLTFGTTLVPNKKLSITFGYSLTDSRVSGGGKPDQSTRDSSTDLAVSYSPFPTLYLFGSWSWLKTNVRSDLLQNYNLNWNPFRGGALQFNFAYTESLRQSDKAKARTITPYLRLGLSRASYLSLYYSIISNDSEDPIAGISLRQREKLLVAEYRVNF
jgi:hypothetical protein